MTHIINGMAGNIESHSTLDPGASPLNITAVLDFEHYGFSKLHVINSTAVTFSFIEGADGSVGDVLTLLKKPSTSNPTASSSSAVSSATSSPIVTVTTEVVTSYTTYCPFATTFTQGSSTYTVTEVSFYQGSGIPELQELTEYSSLLP